MSEELRAVPLCGPRVVERLAAVGITQLGQLYGRDPYEVMHEVNPQAGHTIWPPPIAILALQNRIDETGRRCADPPSII